LAGAFEAACCVGGCTLARELLQLQLSHELYLLLFWTLKQDNSNHTESLGITLSMDGGSGTIGKNDITFKVKIPFPRS
jgi:hypothetical protein